ncbi:calcium-activated chloride channel regulator 1-like isoform X1 [Dermacentor albipictus]|uniref:calcium-activated chloride channel regulator 1-like isoform X1 n=1 Tax=Dermacentor albipictus TaxID=60249 RepID=UPI0031FE2CB3
MWDMNARAAIGVVVFATLCFPRGSGVGAFRDQVPRLEGHGYTDIIVRLPHGLKQRDPGEFIGQLERLLRRASGKLLQASDGLWYFKGIRVVVPPEMETPRNLLLQDATWELFNDAHIVLTKQGSKCKARQSRGCGERGDLVALPVSTLDASVDIDAAASSVVRSWAQFRYGVFEETAFGSRPQWCFYDGHFWRPTGCYTTNVTARPYMNTEGTWECSRKDVGVKQIFQSASEPASSLMFTSSIQKVQKFCDTRGNHSHLHWAPTKHNALCKARSVWEVIRDSPDYSPSIQPLSMQPATLFDYVKPRTHRYFYVVQACAPDPADAVYSKIMASMNEGLRRFLYAAPRGSHWNVVLLDGGNITAPTETDFDSGNTTWQARWEYLRKLDRSVKYNCTSPDVDSFVKIIPKVAQNEATTVIALLHSNSVTAAVVEALAAIDTVRLVLILFDTAATPQQSAWRSTVLRANLLFMVPAAASQESMAALVDLALHTTHHATADLDGDVVKVYQNTDVTLGDGVNGNFSFKSFDSNVLSFIVACPDVYNIEEGDVTFNGTLVPSHRVKMSMFATEQKLTEDPDIVNVDYAVRARKSSQRCSFMASIRGSVQEPRVRLRGWFRRKKVDTPFPQVLYAELLYGEQAVKGATIEAVVYYVAQNIVTTTIIQLRDNGLLEPDVSKGDGVYSGYFLAASRRGGWYSVLLRATGNHATSVGSDARPGAFFQREEFIGSFWASGQNKAQFPPGTVRDLSIKRTELPNVTLEWSAPGSEYDSGDGVGSTYELRYSLDQRRLLNDFANQPSVEFEQQQQPGDYESATLSLPEMKDDNTVVYYIGLRTKNKERRHSDISNIVAVVVEGRFGMNIVNPDSNNTRENTSAIINATATDAVSHAVPNSTARTMLMTTPDDITSSSDLLYLNHFTEHQFYYLVAGVAGGFVLLVLLVNCLICLICLRHRRSDGKCRDTECVVIENAVGPDKPINAYEERTRFDAPGTVGALRQKLSNLSQRRDRANNTTLENSPGEAVSAAPSSTKHFDPDPPIALASFKGQAQPDSGGPSAMARSATKEKPRSVDTVAAKSRANNIGEKAPATSGPEPMLQRRASGSIRSSKRSNASSRVTRVSDRSRRTDRSRAPVIGDHARKRSGDYYDLGIV